jgi:hypothetical protein
MSSRGAAAGFDVNRAPLGFGLTASPGFLAVDPRLAIGAPDVPTLSWQVSGGDGGRSGFELVRREKVVLSDGRLVPALRYSWPLTWSLGAQEGKPS